MLKRLDTLIPTIETADLTERQKRDMISAVRNVIRLAGLNGEDELDLVQLRSALEKMARNHPDLSAGRIANLRSLFGKALALVTPVMQGRSSQPLTRSWARLADQLAFRDRTRLLPALRHFSERDIEPDQVSDAALEIFRDTYLDLSLRQRRERAWDALAVSWNLAVRSVPTWPRIFLPQEFSRDIYIKEWLNFPPALQDEVIRMLDNWPGGSLGPTTRRIYEHRMRSAASILVQQHFTAARLRTINDLVGFDAFSRILRFMMERHEGTATPAVQQMARFLVMVAQTWVRLPESELSAHRVLVKRLNKA